MGSWRRVGMSVRGVGMSVRGVGKVLGSQSRMKVLHLSLAAVTDFLKGPNHVPTLVVCYSWFRVITDGQLGMSLACK